MTLRLILGLKELNSPSANYVIRGLNIYELGGSRVIVTVMFDKLESNHRPLRHSNTGLWIQRRNKGVGGMVHVMFDKLESTHRTLRDSNHRTLRHSNPGYGVGDGRG